MLKTCKGIFHDGKIDLLELPETLDGNIPVIVTFLESVGSIDLEHRGMSKSAALDLRTRLSTFQEDWDAPDMDEYDKHYGRP